MRRPRSKELIVKDLEKLVATKGYMNVLCEIGSKDIFVNSLDIQAPSENTLTIQEMIYIVGLALKNNTMDWSDIDDETIQKSMHFTYILLDELHWSHSRPFSKMMAEEMKAPKNNPLDFIKQTFCDGDGSIEASFYADTNAYDMQYIEFAPKLYVNDMEKIKSFGLDFEKASIIFQALKLLMEVLHTARIKPDNFPLLKDEMPSDKLSAKDDFVFPFSTICEYAVGMGLKKNISISKDDVKNFLKIFSIEPGYQKQESFKYPGDLNPLYIKPIIYLTGDKEDMYYIPVAFFIAKSIYESPAYWMKKDPNYFDTLAKNRGKAIEDICCEYISKVFGRRKTYVGVTIFNGKKRYTDIDAMAIHNGTAIIIQSKGKKLTEASFRGDGGIIQNDFNKSINNAYKQGIKSRDALLSKSNFTFKDRNGNIIDFASQNVKEAYIICVTADVYPNIIMQTQILLDKKESDPWCIPLNLFDLEILTRYIKNADLFVRYIDQRIKTFAKIYTFNETCALGYFLSNKNDLTIPPNTGILHIEKDFAKEIDEDYIQAYHSFTSPKNKKSNSNRQKRKKSKLKKKKIAKKNKRKSQRNNRKK